MGAGKSKQKQSIKNKTHNDKSIKNIKKQSKQTITKHERKKGSKIVDADGFCMAQLETLFSKYADDHDPNIIGPEGMEKFCADLCVDPEDIVMLVIAWHLNAGRMCYFSKEEFIRGFEKLRLDSIDGIKARIQSFREEINNLQTFKEIHEYAFLFAREEEKRNIDKETAIALLDLLFEDKYNFGSEMREFLEEQNDYKAVNKDQWRNLLEFSLSIEPDLSNYNADDCWPCMLDEFVQYLVSKDADKYHLPVKEEDEEEGYFTYHHHY